jgi:dihydrolipoamide dehydrogenase
MPAKTVRLNGLVVPVKSLDVQGAGAAAVLAPVAAPVTTPVAAPVAAPPISSDYTPPYRQSPVALSASENVAISYAGTANMDCDLLVLGAGPGGYSAAFRAADLGLIWG